jgi:hypothetical protein
MDTFSTQNSVVFVNGDYFVYPWVDGDMAIVTTLKMFTNRVEWMYATPYTVCNINPAVVKSVQILAGFPVLHIKARLCSDIIYASCDVKYTSRWYVPDKCKPSMLQICQFLTNEVY